MRRGLPLSILAAALLVDQSAPVSLRRVPENDDPQQPRAPTTKGPSPADLSRIEKAQQKRDRKRAVRRAHLAKHQSQPSEDANGN